MQIIDVDGMTCGHCVETVTKALSKLSGVHNVQVSLEQGNVSFDFEEDKVEMETVRSAITEVGFEVK
ncbi:MAG: heavy-metal-associated domain-containing protein [Candidatus Nitrohelix vancouverensis]|uniref:Heavy-metal-associated domain-containing protein n=1 Tax=Candidatus Nitrohelix vancouverensis TaxID=2705534 RepID=A0A7T0C5D3_9BACT|nr:MAG: heavy-metal-associated domain-containing protein [Candidatus Nitrohelix vancouverensis]